ncbi:HotDog domain-containing protein [Calycina marina]|uniref:HotDog domain-containing protein n=1 Tax=Calycina marina TaxID=1763456 RepID=A0A9P7Z337_9HELO|nr:HotDog domain-containing protein [Calycina marina]
MITRILLRACQPTSQATRPSQCLRVPELALRYYSTSPIPPTPNDHLPPPTKPIDLRSQFNSTPEPANPYFIPISTPKQNRSLRPYIYAALFTILGLTVGQYMRLVVLPPPLPEPHTKEDILMTEWLSKQAERLPLVQSLDGDPKWEVWPGYHRLTDEERKHILTTGPMGGSRGLGGYRQTWQHNVTGECVSVIWVGGAVAGWPGVAHGGATASLMDETMGHCAIMKFPVRTGVTANLELSYLKPVVTNAFYVLRALPVMDGASERKMWVTGRLETLEGRACVEAKALFVVPKKLDTRKY